MPTVSRVRLTLLVEDLDSFPLVGCVTQTCLDPAQRLSTLPQHTNSFSIFKGSFL